MTVRQIPGHVPGHKSAKGFHEIIYHIPAGIQIVNNVDINILSFEFFSMDISDQAGLIVQ